MGETIRKRLRILKMILKEKFPDVTVGFYLIKRNKYLHMGLDQSLSSIEAYKDFKEEINNFLSVNLDSKFKMIKPLLVPTVRWKHNYIIIKKKHESREVMYQLLYLKN